MVVVTATVAVVTVAVAARATKPALLQASHMSKSRDSLHLPRSQSAPISKALRLPRNLHIEAKPLQSPAPASKSRPWTTKI